MWCNLVLYNWLERPRPNRREQGVQEREERRLMGLAQL